MLAIQYKIWGAWNIESKIVCGPALGIYSDCRYSSDLGTSARIYRNFSYAPTSKSFGQIIIPVVDSAVLLLLLLMLMLMLLLLLLLPLLLRYSQKMRERWMLTSWNNMRWIDIGSWQPTTRHQYHVRLDRFASHTFTYASSLWVCFVYFRGFFSDL